jgi:hypothetical protein
MHDQQIRKWLALPDGPWPPDHYALLGLSPADADPGRVEQHAFDRMERLRQYQLSNPDAVTEAMNLLARAMDCLADPRSRSEYDRRQVTPGASPLADSTVEAAADPTADGSAALPSPGDEVLPESLVIAALPPPALPAAPAAPPPPAEPAPPVLATAWARRALLVELRAGLGSLARARRLQRSWEAVGAWLEADRPPAGWSEADELARHLADILRFLPGGPPGLGDVGGTGHLVVALARQPLTLATLRELLPSQRTALGRDWREGVKALRRHRRHLRETLPRRPRPTWLRSVRLAARSAVAYPELVWLAVGAAALLVAGWRASSGW